jgi:hypothetical protein
MLHEYPLLAKSCGWRPVKLYRFIIAGYRIFISESGMMTELRISSVRYG